MDRSGRADGSRRSRVRRDRTGETGLEAEVARLRTEVQALRAQGSAAADPVPAPALMSRRGLITAAGVAVVGGVSGAVLAAGPAGAQAVPAIVLLDAPVRVYDSRPTEPPAVGVKGPLAAGTERTVDLNASAGLSVAVSGVLVMLTIANTVDSGFLSVRKGGTGPSLFSSINWYQSGQITANSVVCAVQVVGSRYNVVVRCGGIGSTDFLIDVVGFYQ